MTRAEFILSALSTADRQSFTPVQLQKLFFILDEEIPDDIEGPLFAFTAYHYGPFDHQVYREIEDLEEQGSVICNRLPGETYRIYATTPDGQEKGEQLFKSLDESAQEYIEVVSDFVRSCSFSELVSVIY